jgi:hypothetical protein
MLSVSCAAKQAQEVLGSQLLLHYGSKEQLFGALAAGIPDTMANFTGQVAQTVTKYCKALGIPTERYRTLRPLLAHTLTQTPAHLHHTSLTLHTLRHPHYILADALSHTHTYTHTHTDARRRIHKRMGRRDIHSLAY